MMVYDRTAFLSCFIDRPHCTNLAQRLIGNTILILPTLRVWSAKSNSTEKVEVACSMLRLIYEEVCVVNAIRVLSIIPFVARSALQNYTMMFDNKIKVLSTNYPNKKYTLNMLSGLSKVISK